MTASITNYTATSVCLSACLPICLAVCPHERAHLGKTVVYLSRANYNNYYDVVNGLLRFYEGCAVV